MSICLYGNGIIEEFKPKNLVFNDDEIINIFNDYDIIRTKRLNEVLNTWCIWGDNHKKNDDEYSSIGSNILEEPIFSVLCLIHDSELDPSWMLTDNIIYKDYSEFKNDLMAYIDHIAQITIEEQQQQKIENGTVDNIVFLTTMGSTDDKRILFEFNLEKQNNNFFLDDNFVHFAIKIINYLKKQKKFTIKGNMFYIYEDAKMIMYTEKQKVKNILIHIIDFYNEKEKYEDCLDVKKINDKILKQEKQKTRKKNE